MRPVRLEMRGFTAFRDPQEIDFRDLDLFALWGPTGSGKSSVLDAITYALFGYVERVGREASQLVSQGQPRMAVTLDFQVGAETYRVTRSTPASGTTTARLEVRRGDEFVSFGERADQVKGVNELVKEVLGLDYEAFSRSVILPQGKFAEFLTGEPKNRRRILTELLGLELFKRMAQRANEVARDARVNAEAKDQFLERDYAGVDEAAVEGARSRAKEAAAGAKVLSAAEKKISSLRERWEDEGRAIASLADCAGEIADLSATFGEQTRALEETILDLVPLEGGLAAAREEAVRAEEAASAARAAVDEYLERHGDLERLTALRQVGVLAEKARAELDAARGSLETETARETTARDELEASKELLDKAGAELRRAAADLAERQAEHERAHGADKVGSLVHGLGVGDPCPVCERPLERLPVIAGDALAAAKQTLATATAAQESASRAVHSAEKDVAVATQTLTTARENVARCKSEVEKKQTELAAHESELMRAFGGTVPDDAGVQIKGRTAMLKKLGAGVEAAVKVHADLVTKLTERTRELESARGRVGEIKAALAAASLRPAFQRVAKAAPKVALPEPWPEDPPTEEAQLIGLARELAGKLTVLAGKLDAAREKAEEARAKLLGQALAALPGELDADVDDLKTLATAVGDLARRASEDAALEKKAAADLEARLAAANAMRAEVAAHKEENHVYRALGLELKDDRIVEFLQEEALQVLALAATARLQDLSSGRYKLLFDDGEFLVVDAWNGDEQRSVSTLSGGETFLASLALALALSEQIQLLAVNERNKLESLFLDEGFGTLDAETLEVVVNAIEQLGGEDRLVGVITHVPDLAERLPVRLEVTKSPRGSVVQKSVGELSRVAV